MVTQSTIPTSGGEGDYKDIHITRKGDLYTASFIQGLLLAGKCFGIDVGAFSTGIVGGGNGTVIDIDQPEAVVSVPAGYHILPFYVAAQVQPGLNATDLDEVEILLAVDRDSAYASDGTATAETPFNLFTKKMDTGSVCKCISAATADITDPVLDIELARVAETTDVQSTVGVVPHIIQMTYEPAVVPLISGPAMLVLYWGGTVATVGGFAQLRWAELADADLV
jgi:hypothetical protein